MINYYKELFKKRSYIIKSLTDMSDKNLIFLLNDKSNQVFLQAKAMITKATILCFFIFRQAV